MKLLTCENAQAEFVGHVIILGITIIGISMVALYGVPSILSLQDMANVKNAEQTFAVLDFRAGRTVLGDSPLQTTGINLGGGTLTVVPNSTNSTSFMAVNGAIFNFTIPMGKVKYELGDRTVAYEDGGVWSQYASGSVMLSRPDFDYNGVTLTLPVFNISGNTSVGGKGTAMVSFKKNNPPVVLFPRFNASQRLTYTWSGQWLFNTTTDAWSPDLSGNCMSNGSSGGYYDSLYGNPAGSISSCIFKTSIVNPVITTWTSPPFLWTNGTPASASLSFDWSVPNYTSKANPSSFSVNLYRPDNISSPIYSTSFPPILPGWPHISVPIDPRNLALSGNYYLQIVSTLNRQPGGPNEPVIKVDWDNPTITITYDFADRTRLDPVNLAIGKVYVNITSDFYDAWADYIRSVSSVKIVSEDAINHTTSVALTVYPPYVGDASSPIVDPIVFRGIDGSNPNPLNKFKFRIYISGMNKWDIRAKNGDRELMYYLDQNNTLSVAYMNTTTGNAETWGTYLYIVQTDANGNQYIDVDLLDNSINLNYQDLKSVGADSANACQQFGGEISGSSDPAYSWAPTFINQTTNNASSLNIITQHYIQQMAQLGDITFSECVPSGYKLPAPGSTMYVDYTTPGGLTYLYITDNKADVGIS